MPDMAFAPGPRGAEQAFETAMPPLYQNRPLVRPNAGESDVLALAESLVSSLSSTYSRDDLETLKTVVEGHPDRSAAGAGQVVASLAGLLEVLMESQRVDKAALTVHVRAWRLMVSAQPDPQERDRLLDGLRLVRELYEVKLG